MKIELRGAVDIHNRLRKLAPRLADLPSLHAWCTIRIRSIASFLPGGSRIFWPTIRPLVPSPAYSMCLKERHETG